MHALVTGVAGFVGSHLAERLLQRGWNVRGIDCFNDYYHPSLKWKNVAALHEHGAFELIEADLRVADLGSLLEGTDVVYHLAGQPGVRLSWADGFSTYTELNINVTQRLLEAARGASLHRFVYASSSSIYGEPTIAPTPEDHPTRPFSPYGVTKLAGELLCTAYAANFGLPTVCPRFFTVYGPRQRPDMAINRMIAAAMRGDSFPVYGDGQQIRDFTFVTDVAEATLRCGTADLPPGTVVNVAGGSSTRLVDLISVVGEALGEPLRIEWREAQAGDVFRTGGDISRAQALLGWSPEVDIAEGVRRQVEWQRSVGL
ncbi:MAG: NAD-dependent epimerase/dehydratase family protein [Ilumatobacteraceae bacterium]